MSENNPRKDLIIKTKIWAILMIIGPLLVMGALATILYIYLDAYNGIWNIALIGLGIFGTLLISFLFVRCGFRLYHHIQPFKDKIPFKGKRILKDITLLLTLTLVIGSFGLYYIGFSRLPYKAFDAGPYLTLMNDQEPQDSITVCWHSSKSQPSVVLYGTSPESLSTTAISQDVHQSHFVRLDNLSPATTYYYEVQNQDFGMKNFTTAPAAGQAVNFTFNIWADPRTNNGYETAKNGVNLPSYMVQDLRAKNQELAFSIVTGDIVSDGPSIETWALYMEDLTSEDFAAHSFNIDAIGNHEHHGDPNLVNFRQFYPYESCNFSFVYGQLFVLVLDTFNYQEGYWYDVQFPEIQKEWAKAELQAHMDSPFKIIALHQSPINYGKFTYGDHHGNISAAILELTNTYGVDALFCGHSHHYEVERLNNTLFVMEGIGGNANRENWVYGGWDTEVTLAGGEILASGGEDTGWIQVDMTPDQMHIRPVMIDGTEYSGFLLNATDNPD